MGSRALLPAIATKSSQPLPSKNANKNPVKLFYVFIYLCIHPYVYMCSPASSTSSCRIAHDNAATWQRKKLVEKGEIIQRCFRPSAISTWSII